MKETKFKDTEIGKIPEEWSICNFGDIFTFFSNNTLSRDMLGERGDMHNVHYGDVLIKYGSTLDVEKESIPSIKEEYCYKSTPDFVTFLRHVCKCLIIKGRSRCFG